MKNILSAFAITAVAMAVSPAVHAAHNLPAGDVASPLALGLPDGFSTANLLASSMSTLSAPGNSFTATFSSAVYANTASAVDGMAPGFTAGASVLDFVYQISNSPNSASSLSRLTFFDFAPGLDPNQFSLLLWQTGTDIDGAGSPLFSMGAQAPTDADRGANGKTVGVNFDTTIPGKINPGETSFTLIVRANTSNYATGFFSAINGTTATVSSFAPVAAIPEPETYALMLAGLGALGFVARRRKS